MYLPVMICGSAAWHLTVATVLVWPDSVCTLALVLMSHTCMDRRNQIEFNYWSMQRPDYLHIIGFNYKNEVFPLIQGRMSMLISEGCLGIRWQIQKLLILLKQHKFNKKKSESWPWAHQTWYEATGALLPELFNFLKLWPADSPLSNPRDFCLHCLVHLFWFRRKKSI